MVDKSRVIKAWAIIMLLAGLDGLVTRFALANGATELNPLVDTTNLALYQVLELLSVSFLVFLNAVSLRRPYATTFGVSLFRATTKAIRIATWILFIVVTWNVVNILLDMVLT